MGNGAVIEGIYREPTASTDINFTIKRTVSVVGTPSAGANWTNSIFAGSVASAGAAMFGSGGANIKAYSQAYKGYQLEMLLFTD